MEKITVSAFVEGYKKINNTASKEAYITKHILRTYAPLLMKKEILSIMCEKSVVNDTNKYIDLTLNKLNLVMAILGLYTDIEPDKDDEGTSLSWKAYDQLKETGLLELISKKIGTDVDELLAVQKEVLDTWYVKNTSTEAYITNLVDFASKNFGLIIGAGMDKLSDIFNDEKKSKKLLETFITTFKLNK